MNITSFLNNHLLIYKGSFSKILGRGKYFRKRVFSTSRILQKNFKEKETFVFLQVGANDGVSFDFLFHFVKKRHSKGIVIEPVGNYYKELCANYFDFKEIIKINKAVHSRLKEVGIYKIKDTELSKYPDWAKGIASFQKSHLQKFDVINNDDIIEEKVQADTLEHIIEDSGLEEFDYFQVDTEGYDYEVVDMFDFSKRKPKVIRAEYINLPDSDKEKFRKLLTKNGYFIFFEALDIVAVDLKKINL
jgi:FkbM family methyltransferase